MTKEEAKEVLEKEKAYMLGHGGDRQAEALDMAIKALEQQSSEDCVSRQATLDAIIKELCIKDESYLLQSEKVIYNVVKNMPPVTPTFPKGETNGDMIKAMFPSVEVKEKNNCYEVYFGIGTASQYFNHQWWNALYKRGNENDSN